MKCKKSEKGTTGIQHHFAVNNDRPLARKGNTPSQPDKGCILLQQIFFIIFYTSLFQ